MRSAWVDAERKRYADLLSGNACDTLVVPIQSQYEGFDRATRSLMTAQLALALAAQPGRCVVDPYLASDALGEGMRRFDHRAIAELAASVKAKTVVTAYVGHVAHMKMEIFVRIEKPMREGSPLYVESAHKSWSDLPFADDHPPFIVWQDLLPEVASALDLGKIEHAKSLSTADSIPPLQLPDAPEQLVTKPSQGPLDDARRYELLATLGPWPEFRPTERLFEKAWLAASSAADTPESRLVRARALLHLGYRPVGLALLGTDDGAEAQTLRALLDGNLPEATTAAEKVHDAVPKLVTALEVHDLQFKYGQAKAKDALPAAVADAKLRSASWEALLVPRGGEIDNWQVDDNLALKALLDSLYPIKGFSVDEVVRGSIAVGGVPKDGDYDLLAKQHVDRLLAQQSQRFCCATFGLRPSELDFLQLVAARAQANLEKRFNHEAWVQGRIDHALALADAYDAEFRGHPHFAALRAHALIEKTINSKDARESEDKERAFAEARKAVFFEQAGTHYSSMALLSFGIPSAGSQPFMGAYDDFPPKAGWAPAAQALDYSSYFPGTEFFRLSGAGPQRDRLLSAIATRFHGSRDAERMIADAKVGAAGADSAALRARIDRDPGNWESYVQLAQMLVRDGDVEGVVAAARKYPGFAENSGENSVALSNHATQIASMLFWMGHVDSAREFYELAAHYENGSDASLLGAQRVRLIDGDYAGAAANAHTRVVRYGNPYAIRDYLQLLFALGHSRDAWAAFMGAADRFEAPEFWFAAIIGKRVDGASPEAVGEWLSGDSVRSINVKGDIPALRMGMMYFLVDRAPFAGLPDLLARVEGKPVLYVDEESGSVRRPEPVGNGLTGFSPVARSAFRADKRTGKTGDLVPSQYVLFASAYSALRQGDYAAAVDGFAKYANYYAIEGDYWVPNTSVALPYFAFAAAKSGDTLQLEAFLDGLPKDPSSIGPGITMGTSENRRFEWQLAKADFAGLKHHKDEALQHLAAALAGMPLTMGTNGINGYQYAETCIWLYEETKEAQYRDLALAWAHTFQRMEPTMAWAYALEARYGDPKDKDHVRAVALALYLDRNSLWLSGVPKADIDRARDWLTRNNPFRVKTAAAHATI